MQEDYIGLEDNIINYITIKDSIKQLKPEAIELIIEEFGDIDTYISSLQNKESANKIFDHIGQMKGQEQKVIMLRFGLIDGKSRTLEEVAKIMGTTRERIRLIESKCFRKGGCVALHRRKKLIDYLDE